MSKYPQKSHLQDRDSEARSRSKMSENDVEGIEGTERIRKLGIS